MSCCVKATASVSSNNKSTALIWLSNNDWTFYRHLGDFFHGNNNLAKNSPKIFGIKNTHFSYQICLGNFRRFLIKIGQLFTQTNWSHCSARPRCSVENRSSLPSPHRNFSQASEVEWRLNSSEIRLNDLSHNSHPQTSRGFLTMVPEPSSMNYVKRILGRCASSEPCRKDGQM